MNHCSVSLTAWVLLALSGSASAQQDFSNVKIKSTHVSGPIYMLEGSGGNIGVSAGPDGVLIVDDQFAPLADKIRSAIEKLGKGKLKFVLNTHWHGDHTGGNSEFGPQAPIIAQTNVRKRLSTQQKVRDRVIEPSPAMALPVITFDRSLSVHFNGEEIRVMHFPHSHTDGDSVIFFTQSKVVHMGDLFFAGMFPFVDLQSGGDVVHLSASIGQILDRLTPDVKIIPGHGPLSSVEDLRAYHQMLIATIDIVRGRIAAGKTLDEIKKEGLPEKWKSWGTGFIKTDPWLETIYTSLTKKQSSSGK